MISDLNPYSGREDLAYIAGFMDADGSYMIRKNNEDCCIPQVTITNTNSGILLFIKSKLESYGIKSYLYSGKQRDKKWKVSFMLSIHKRSDVLAFCKLLSPYIVLKAKQASIIIEMLEALQTGRGPRRKIIEGDFQERIQELNKRGTTQKFIQGD